MQKVRGHPRDPKTAIGLPPLVSTWFQVLLTPLVGVLFTFQSPYLCTIGCRVVLSLGGWAPQLHTEFHELRATLESRWYRGVITAAYRTVTFCGVPFQALLLVRLL